MTTEEDAQTAAIQDYFEDNRPAGYGASFRAGWDAGNRWSERQLPDFIRRMGDDLQYWKDRAEVAEQNLIVATKALRDIGSNDYVNGGSGIAWRALEAIEDSDDEIGEALERQRHPENQPVTEPCFMCDPSILERARNAPLGSFRCATGFPICDQCRRELTGKRKL